MNDESVTTQNGEKPDATESPIQTAEPINSETTQPATAQQLADVEEKMTGFEKATLRWAKIAVLLSGLASIFVCAQWYEMHLGGQDTHALAEAANKQAEKMSTVSDAADKIRKAAQDMVIQDQRIADNAQDAIKASNRQSKETLDATIQNAHRDQRAWVFVPNFTLDKEPAEGDIPQVLCHVINSGKTPAISLVNKQALAIWTTQFPKPNWPQVPVKPGGPITLPPSQGVFNVVAELDPLSKLTADAYRAKTSEMYVRGFITYNDVFGHAHWVEFCAMHEFGTPLDHFSNCDQNNDTDRDY